MAPREELSAKLDRGHYRLTMRCSGGGIPTVVFDGNLRGSSLEWQTVRDKVAAFTRVCTYDREGMARPALTSRQIAEDLRELLHRAGAMPPYVLVGWAFGGYTVRVYTHQWRNEVAGLVLVDALHEDFFTRYRLVLPPQASAGSDPLQDFRYQLAGGYRYLADMEASAGEVRAMRTPLENLPLAVVSRSDPDWPNGIPAELTTRLEQTWQTMQTQLAGLSANSLHVVAARSGHLVQYDRPDVVVDAIRKVVEVVRTGGSLTRS
jgi:pimeloyl-ACP methyl ester carboxylesterase